MIIGVKPLSTSSLTLWLRISTVTHCGQRFSDEGCQFSYSSIFQRGCTRSEREATQCKPLKNALVRPPDVFKNTPFKWNATPSPALQAWGAHKMLPHVLNRASQRAWPLQAFVTVAGLRPRQTMTPNPFQGPQRARPARYSGSRRRSMQGPSQAVYGGQIRVYLGHPSSRQRAARRIPVSPPLSDA